MQKTMLFVSKRFKSHCSVFGWDGVSFFHSSQYGAMFRICTDYSVDNTGMFQLLQHSAYTARTFSAPHTAPPASRLGVYNKLRGDTAGWPKDNPYSMMAHSAYKGRGRRRKQGGHLELRCLSSQVTTMWMETCFPGGG